MEELNQGGINLGPSIINVKLKREFALKIGGFLEATQKISQFFDFQKMTYWEVNHIYQHWKIHINM